MFINTATELVRFRSDWGGEAMLRRLQLCGGKMLVNWPVGVGKSVNCDALIEAAARSGIYDFIIVLSPTWAIIRERKWVREQPVSHRVGLLFPRPREQCGDLDAQWQVLETRQMSHLGKEILCQDCPLRDSCTWPQQMSRENLEPLDVLFATQTHLEIDPMFLQRIPIVSSSLRTLVILDEDSFAKVKLQRSIRPDELTRFYRSLEAVAAPDNPNTRHETIKDLVYAMMMAKTSDLATPSWNMPVFGHQWSLQVQQAGWGLFNSDYRFLGYDLSLFCRSPIESRWRDEHNVIHYAFSPFLEHDTVVYSGTAEPDLIEYRLGVKLENAFESYEFKHPDTRWINIASSVGAACHFKRNSDQILHFFAALTAKRIREGKRVLLIAKKMFVPFCAKEMQQRLRDLGIEDATVITQFEGADLSRPSVVPLINYGVIGINLFEGFDAAYCLTSYNTNDNLLNQSLQEMLAKNLHIGVEITIPVARPRRRIARAVLPQDEVYSTAQVAQHALVALEMDPVLQAVGRVRPYTKPREVITFQCSAFPSQPYDHEFDTLDEARHYFEIATSRESAKQTTVERVQQAKRTGLSTKKAAENLGISLRTIQRYW